MMNQSNPVYDVINNSHVTTSVEGFSKAQVSADEHKWKQYYETVHFYSYDICLPIVLSLGILGNILNLVVLTRRRLRSAMDVMENSSAIGLIALAMSDLLFCIVGLPKPFLSGRLSKTAKMVGLYYGCYHMALTNTFLFTSTWFTVSVASERFFAISCPFRARQIIRVRRTIAVVAVVFIISILFNIPHFLATSVQTATYGDKTYRFKSESQLKKNHVFWHAYTTCWAVFGTFIPLVMLIVCNVGLVVEIYRKTRSRFATCESESGTTFRSTAILLGIVIFFFILVCPSTVLKFFNDFISKDNGKHYSFKTAMVITNVMQALNFAINFVLYVAISKHFRDTIRLSFCLAKKQNGRSFASSETQRYRLVDLHSHDNSSKL